MKKITIDIKKNSILNRNCFSIRIRIRIDIAFTSTALVFTISNLRCLLKFIADDQSIVSSITVGSTSSLRSVTSDTVSSIYMNENGVAANEDGKFIISFLVFILHKRPSSRSAFTALMFKVSCKILSKNNLQHSVCIIRLVVIS